MRSAVAPEKRVRANDIPATLVAVYNRISPLVEGNSSSTRPAYKREYLYIHS